MVRLLLNLRLGLIARSLLIRLDRLSGCHLLRILLDGLLRWNRKCLLRSILLLDRRYSLPWKWLLVLLWGLTDRRGGHERLCRRRNWVIHHLLLSYRLLRNLPICFGLLAALRLICRCVSLLIRLLCVALLLVFRLDVALLIANRLGRCWLSDDWLMRLLVGSLLIRLLLIALLIALLLVRLPWVSLLLVPL